MTGYHPDPLPEPPLIAYTCVDGTLDEVYPLRKPRGRGPILAA